MHNCKSSITFNNRDFKELSLRMGALHQITKVWTVIETLYNIKINAEPEKLKPHSPLALQKITSYLSLLLTNSVTRELLSVQESTEKQYTRSVSQLCLRWIRMIDENPMYMSNQQKEKSHVIFKSIITNRIVNILNICSSPIEVSSLIRTSRRVTKALNYPVHMGLLQKGQMIRTPSFIRISKSTLPEMLTLLKDKSFETKLDLASSTYQLSSSSISVRESTPRLQSD